MQKAKFFDLLGRDAVVTSGLVALGAALSLVLSGFIISNNNLFHMPILLGLYDEPNFADDKLIQSLRYYASGLWVFLAGAGKTMDLNVIFFSGLVISRLLMFGGFLFCAQGMGVKTRTEKFIAVLLFATVYFLYKDAIAGDGGMFIPQFTHSEIANGLTFFCLGLAVRNRFGTALAVNGSVFFINAFIGAWNFVPMAILAGRAFYRREVEVRPFLKSGFMGGLLFLLMATPVLMNIVSNPAFGQPIDFDYRQYLKDHWHDHFLFAPFSLAVKVKLILLVASCFGFLLLLKDRARPFLWIAAGYTLIYVVGIVLPFITGAPLLLNLHLLRVSLFFHLLAATGYAVYGAKVLSAGDMWERRFFMPSLIFVMTCVKFWALAPFVIFLNFVPKVKSFVLKVGDGKRGLVFAAILLAVSCANVGALVFLRYKDNAFVDRRAAEYKAVGQWARDNTSPDSVFMVPIKKLKPDQSVLSEMAIAEQDYDDVTAFVATAHRKIWVGFKAGGAVMWSQPYYHEWQERTQEEFALKNLDEKLAYARAKGIAYIITVCAVTGDKTVSFRGEHLCVLAADQP